jgi:hypothetical protein
MIQQELKKYEEPAPAQVTYTGQASYTNNFIQEAIQKAKDAGITVGQKYKYKDGDTVIEIVGFETTNTKVMHSYNSLTVIKGKRISCKYSKEQPVFNYSMTELLSNHMEKVT